MLLVVCVLAACGGRSNRDARPHSADDEAASGGTAGAAATDGAALGGAGGAGAQAGVSPAGEAGTGTSVGTAGQAGTATCGDGIVMAPEECDGADPMGATCADFGFDVGEVRCGSDCSYDGAACAHLFQSVDAAAHTCGLKTDGTVVCWGENIYGQATPPDGTFSLVSAGGLHTCAVTTGGTVACWGSQAR